MLLRKFVDHIIENLAYFVSLIFYKSVSFAHIMAKAEQILVIDPNNELTFVGPFTRAVSVTISLKNPSDRKICFKIVKYAPNKRYCVKPKSGVIEPRETAQITVTLQTFQCDLKKEKRHKFLVQSMFAPEGEINQDILWKETNRSQLRNFKLKCVFVMPNNIQDYHPKVSYRNINYE